MNRRLFLAGTAALTAITTPKAFAIGQDAAGAVADASASAETAGRPLLLVFHASWCGYCTVFDMMLADRKAGAIVDRHFSVFHLRALEKKPEQQALQLAGADDVFYRYAPKDAGLPYMAVLGKGAAKVTDSIMPTGENFGFPVTRPELDAFEAMMKAGAPAMTASELRTLRKTCVTLIEKS